MTEGVEYLSLPPSVCELNAMSYWSHLHLLSLALSLRIEQLFRQDYDSFLALQREFRSRPPQRLPPPHSQGYFHSSRRQ
ncbi:hypothetical protein FGO68_gene5443 [Halteria grandinella]|uniref:Uncharacterized protein n=1 Tax=Halteria grandinella TaxID=5974 RepID=A0A8J8P6N5_HALGN|nr:hypothetical protein FGO68_gene5443 [Halteria grandinella]